MIGFFKKDEFQILELKGLQILDSRGIPTLKITTILEDRSSGTFSVPSGASVGSNEVVELRDKDLNKYGGKSVYSCLEKLEKIKKKFIGKNFTQKSFDDLLRKIDDTKNKSNLGANLILGLSVSFLKAQANSVGLELYEYIYVYLNGINLTRYKHTRNFKPKQIHLFANILNGGVHCGNDLKIQEFMIIPNEKSTLKNIEIITKVYQKLKKVISKDLGKSQIGVGDEGGFAPEIDSTQKAFDLIKKSIRDEDEEKIFFAIDCASNEFYDKTTKYYEVEKRRRMDYKLLEKYYLNLFKENKLISIEDPFFEESFEEYTEFLKKIENIGDRKNHFFNRNTPIVVGDDLLTSNPKRIEKAIEKFSVNALLLKINQIGTITESFESYNLAKNNNLEVIISHRSGETTDTFIADFAVATNSSIKLGAPCRGERIAKYNRLIEIYSNYYFDLE